MQGLLDAFYAALRRLSADELAALVTPDFVLHWQGTPAIPWAGEWAGPDGLLRFVAVLNAHVQIVSVRPLHTLHGPEGSVVVLEGHWKVPATGAEVRAKATNVFTFSGGRIASYTVVNNTAAFAEALAGPPASLALAPSEVRAVVPTSEVATLQRLPYFLGISGQTVGAAGLSMHLVVIPPGAQAEPHVHVGYETGIYVLEGTVRTRWGAHLEHEVVSTAGQFLFVPAGVPHDATNLSATAPARAVIARNDPAEEDKVVPYRLPDQGGVRP